MQQEIVKSIRSYCAYQERSHAEVRIKLKELGIYSKDAEGYIAYLIEENFLNEERYASSFARGKFYVKKWGKVKIVYRLKQQQISEYCIQKALMEIDDNDYLQTIQHLAEKKKKEMPTSWSNSIKFLRIKNYLLQKGYALSDIIEGLNPKIE